MPIRFRCHYCNQLMGIARRKAGTTVRCPTCHAQLIVPQPEPEGKVDPKCLPVPDPPVPLFERDDFEALLHSPPAGPSAAASPPSSPLAAAIPPGPSFATPSGSPRLRQPAVAFSPTQAVWLIVIVALLLVLAFGAGVFVGLLVGH